jgi:predicted Rossmann fold nucleotide-binding protein DprA/Smf involved in DNA uptake
MSHPPSEPSSVPRIYARLGNETLLSHPKTAFLCSRKVPEAAVLKCYDWAMKQRERGVCVMSGFHSQIEKDVLHYLLKGTQPVIVVLARGLKRKPDAIFTAPLAAGRLLILTPFPVTEKRVTKKTAAIRNQFMSLLADTIVVGFASDGGGLSAMIKTTTGKPVRHLHLRS